MACSCLIVSLSLLVSLPLLLPSIHANETGVICEELPPDLCAFSISSTGRRCVLESSIDGEVTRYQCRTSEVVVANYMSDWIETDECVSSCGLDRNTVGISSDALLEKNFREHLCSISCYQGCPNIIDLYSNLASGEGVSLKEMCKTVHSSRERMLFESESGYEAYSPASPPSSYFK
ncbi:PAR1 protein [Rhynchospora pubera]|uniref:PAR1 protein n=1 Tax=Rhynchospora pubera TaxID=906938 RepID=A0AAV8FVL1_9POAL|nr:PAR1 protein [Rhynchospora pubera]